MCLDGGRPYSTNAIKNDCVSQRYSLSNSAHLIQRMTKQTEYKWTKQRVFLVEKNFHENSVVSNVKWWIKSSFIYQQLSSFLHWQQPCTHTYSHSTLSNSSLLFFSLFLSLWAHYKPFHIMNVSFDFRIQCEFYNDC